MIVVTGAAGFIGSNLVKSLNAQGEDHILVVDDLTQGDKFLNLVDLKIADYMDHHDFRQRLSSNQLPDIKAVFHQGACSDTTERDGCYMMDNNYRFSLELLNYCQQHSIPFIYASSASVYGMGPNYSENQLNEKPLNVYGYSKYLFDQVVRQRLPQAHSQIVGLRYFNVYGPREQHKGRMASVAFHHFQQYQNQAEVKLFAGSDGYRDGDQRRDFIWVGDVVNVNLFFLANPAKSGIFNCGTGHAQAFNEVALAVINQYRQHNSETAFTLEQAVVSGALKYIPFPEDLIGRYQSYTQADLSQLQAAGYTKPFLRVEQGIQAYFQTLFSNTRLS